MAKRTYQVGELCDVCKTPTIASKKNPQEGYCWPCWSKWKDSQNTSTPTPNARPSASQRFTGASETRREQSISKFQDTKELSIRVASSMRDAVLVALESPQFAEMSDEVKKTYILNWRKWFFEKYDVNETVKELTAPF